MIEKLAYVKIIITQQGNTDIPVGTQFRSTEPIRCINGTDEGTKMLERMGGQGDACCEYT